MSAETMLPSFDGTKLYFKKNKIAEPRAAIVIVHGLCEHLGRYDYLTDKLNAQGFNVYRFDHRGHARSEGKRVFYNDFNELVDDVNVVVDVALQENMNIPVFLLGHSMGGFASTLFGTKYPGKVRGIVLSGALTRYNAKIGGDLPIELPADTYVPNILGDGICSDPEVVSAYSNDPLVEKQISIGLFNSFYHGIEWLKKNADHFTDPVFIMHGVLDGLVSEQDSRELFGDIASADKSLKIHAHLMHEIFNEPTRDEVIEEAILWLTKRL